MVREGEMRSRNDSNRLYMVESVPYDDCDHSPAFKRTYLEALLRKGAFRIKDIGNKECYDEL